MYATAGRANRGVTVIEVLMAIFVLLIGVTGVIALFPVGVRLNQMGADDILSAMTAQNALAAVRLQSGLGDRVKAYVSGAGGNTAGDVLGWTTTGEAKGVGGMTGSVSIVGTELPGNPLGRTKIQVTFDGGTVDGRELYAKTAGGTGQATTGNGRALLLMTSGNAMWKLYRLDNLSLVSTSTFASTVNGTTNFPRDRVEAGDTFRLIGARDDSGVWATASGATMPSPSEFYGNGSSSLPPFKLGQGATKDYGYLAVLTRVKGYATLFRVDMLVYKGYDPGMPPEGNLPAVACYTTILSSDMLRND